MRDTSTSRREARRFQLLASACFGAALATLLLTAATMAQAGVPKLRLRALDGSSRSIETLRGHVVLVNFWATWCVPCREEMPLLGRLHREYSPRDVKFIAASADDDTTRDRIVPLMSDTGVEFPVWTGVTTVQMTSLGVGEELPATLILDRDGSIVFRLMGVVSEEALRSRLDWLLGTRVAAMPESTWFGADASVSLSTDDEARIDDRDGHHHGHGETHGHEAAADASLVPS